MKKTAYAVLFAAALFFSFSGMDCEDGGGIELRVVGTNGNFTGYYIIDGGGEHHFSGEDQGSGFYRFSEKLGTFDYVDISVTKSVSESALDVYLYDINGDLIKKENNSSCTAGANSTTTCDNSVDISYTYKVNDTSSSAE